MATPAATSSTVRRTREPGQGEMAVGSFRRLEEIGRGSFATVYKASYSVCNSPNCRHVLASCLRTLLLIVFVLRRMTETTPLQSKEAPLTSTVSHRRSLATWLSSRSTCTSLTRNSKRTSTPRSIYSKASITLTSSP